VHELHRELAACDIAVIQGGLTTAMELVAAQHPFVSIPLARHFEQQLHVRHRLERHGATASIDYADATPDVLAETVARTLATPVNYNPVPSDGASRAAELISTLL
jgi:predicted glycosyltransferase